MPQRQSNRGRVDRSTWVTARRGQPLELLSFIAGACDDRLIEMKVCKTGHNPVMILEKAPGNGEVVPRKFKAMRVVLVALSVPILTQAGVLRFCRCPSVLCPAREKDERYPVPLADKHVEDVKKSSPCESQGANVAGQTPAGG